MGAGAFAYKFYTTRNYQAASTEEPMGRELKEIVTCPQPANSNGTQVIREEEPLVRSEEQMESGKEKEVINESQPNEQEHTIFGTQANSERNHTKTTPS